MAVGFCYLVLMVNVPSRLTPELYSIVAALALRVVDIAFFLVVKNMLEVMMYIKASTSHFFIVSIIL